MTRVLALLAGGVCAAAAGGASPDPKDLAVPPQELSKARELVRRLGSESYRDREEAHAELVRMGRLARPALLEAAGADPDPEVRFRCSRLLPRAGADDLKARLDTFLADTEGKYEHDLPGLKPFRKVAGEDDKARALFAEVVKSPYSVELLQALDRAPAEAGRAVADRRVMLYSQISQRFVGGRVQPAQPITVPDFACLLVAETVVPSKEIPRGAGQFGFATGATLFQQGQAQALVTPLTNAAAPHADVYRRVVGRWMETREDVQELAQLSYVAGQQLKSMPQSTAVLRKIVATDGVQGYAKSQALNYLIQGPNAKDEIPYITKLLANDTMVTTVWFGGGPNQNQQHTCLMKDVALAHLLALTKQNMQDYGFQCQPGGVLDARSLGSYAFTTETARAAAMVKFGFWRLKEGLKNPAAAGAEPKKDPAPQPGPKPGGAPAPAPVPQPAPAVPPGK